MAKKSTNTQTTLKLTDKELNQVSGAQKNPRPTYYSAGLGVDLEITADFEAVLILTSSQTKQSLKSLLNTNITSGTRESVIGKMLDVDLSNANKVYKTANTALSTLSTASDTVLKDPRFQGTVDEISLLVSDAQIGVEDVVIARNRAKYGIVTSTIYKARLNKNSVGAPERKQRSSWVRILSEYP